MVYLEKSNSPTEANWGRNAILGPASNFFIRSIFNPPPPPAPSKEIMVRPLEREREGGGRKREEDFKELYSILFLLTIKHYFIFLCKTTRAET